VNKEEEPASFRLASDTKENALQLNLLEEEQVAERPERRVAPETNDSEGEDPYSNDEFGESPDLDETENFSGTDPNISALLPITAQNDYEIDVQD